MVGMTRSYGVSAFLGVLVFLNGSLSPVLEGGSDIQGELFVIYASDTASMDDDMK